MPTAIANEKKKKGVASPAEQPSADKQHTCPLWAVWLFKKKPKKKGEKQK